MLPVDEKMGHAFSEDSPLSSKSNRKVPDPLDLEVPSLTREVPYSRLIKKLQNSPLKSIYTVLIKAKINVLLPFGPLAIFLHYLSQKQVSNSLNIAMFSVCFILKNLYSWAMLILSNVLRNS